MTEMNDTMPDEQLEPTETSPTSPSESVRRARRPDTDRTWPPVEPRERPHHDSIPGAETLLAHIETRPPLETATHAESEGNDAVDYATVARPAKRRQGGDDLPAAGIIVAMTEPMPRPVVAPLRGAPGQTANDARARRGPQPTTVVGALRARFSRRNISVGTAALLVGSAFTAALLLREPSPRRSTLTSARMPDETTTTAVTTATMVAPPSAETAATSLSLEHTSTGSTSSAAVVGVGAGGSPPPSASLSDRPSASSPLAAEPNKDTPNAVPKPAMPPSALPTALTAPAVVTEPGTQSKRERIKDDGPRSWQ